MRPSKILLTITTAIPSDQDSYLRFAHSSTPEPGTGGSRTFDELLSNSLGSLVTGKRRVRRHGRLFHANERLDLLFVVRSGQFKLIGKDSNGQEHVAGFHMTGDWMGLEAIASGHHGFSVVALEDSEVLEVSFSTAAGLMRDHPAMQQLFFEAMSQALRGEYHDSIHASASLEPRFARFLQKLGKKYALLGYSPTSYRLAMSRCDIACYLSTTLASISRLVTRFNAGQVVTIRGRYVEVHDCVALDNLKNGAQFDVKPAAVH
jgi:CRP/FNR family transcriptional regulator